MPAPIVGAEQVESNQDRLVRHPLAVGGQSDLADKRKQMVAIGNQALQQTLVHGQVLRSRVLREHALVFAFPERFDLLKPDRDFGVNPKFRVITENQVLDRTPLSF